MQDYKEAMKTILAKYYEPTSIFEKVMPVYEATTSKMLHWFRGVIPENPIDEHDVYDVLLELGFQQKQKILFDKVQISEGNPKKGIKPEFEDVEVGRVLVWHLYEIL